MTFALSSPHRGRLDAACGLIAGCSSVENLLAGDKVDYKSSSSDTHQQPRSAARPDPAVARFALPAARRHGQRLGVPGRHGSHDGGDGRARARDGGTAGGRGLQDRAARQRALAEHDPAAGGGLSAGAARSGRTTASTSSRTGRMPACSRPTGPKTAPSCPNDLIRSTIGKVFDRPTRPASSTSSAPASNARPPAATSTSRTAAWKRSTSASASDATTWQPRPSDPQLEADFLARLMVKLGAKDEQAKAVVAAAATAAGRAGPRARPGRPADADPAGRRRLRPRLASGRHRARPQRLHRRGPRPRPGPLLRALRRSVLRRPRGAGLLQPPVRFGQQEGRERASPGTA